MVLPSACSARGSPLSIPRFTATTTATAMSSATADHAGIASAVDNDVARFGGLLAVAILPALAGITGPAYLHPSSACTAASMRLH